MSNDPTNAERQARHRAKQREYVQGLEAEATRLRAEVRARLPRQPTKTSSTMCDEASSTLCGSWRNWSKTDNWRPRTTTAPDDDDDFEDDDEEEEDDAEELLALIRRLTDKLDEQHKVNAFLWERVKHYRDLVETHMNAIVHDMIVQVRKGRKKELTGPQVLLKLNPWATAEQLDEMAND